MRNTLVAALLLAAAAPLRAQVAIQPQRAAVAGEVRALGYFPESTRRLEACGSVRCLRAWGEAFFPEANALAAKKPDLAGKIRLIDSEYRVLLSQAVKAETPAPPPAVVSRGRETLKGAVNGLGNAKKGGDTMIVLGKLFDNNIVGGPVPVVVASRDWRSPLSKPAKVSSPAARRLAALPPQRPTAPTRPISAIERAGSAALKGSVSPASWSESLVRALFVAPKTKKDPEPAAPVAVEYRMDGKGQIVRVTVPEYAYAEDREFADGLVVRNTVHRDGEVIVISNQYDKQGRLVRRSAVSRDAEGKVLSAASDMDPKTKKARRTIGHADLLLRELPFAAEVAGLVLDWQISREDRLKIEKDTRPRDFHSPFWDGRWEGVSREFTDPDLPKTWKKHPILGVKRPHEGLDLPADEGTKVYPARRGKVTAVGWEAGYGLRVRVQHYQDNRPDGAPDDLTVYGHLLKSSVKKGQWITPGKDVLGLVGSTGLSTGPHLHFEVHGSDGKAVDPAERLSPSLPNRAVRAVLDPRLARTFPN